MQKPMHRSVAKEIMWQITILFSLQVFSPAIAPDRGPLCTARLRHAVWFAGVVIINGIRINQLGN